ncbi:MAG: folylpolyglutamate synthase/dihydrofolate synthase family protein [Chitinophagales bacterium]
MNYNDTIAYLFEQLPAYQRVGKSAFKKDLTNIIKLCSYLDHPQNKFKSIHIAGTNGKGSTAHMLSSIFQTAGYKTGLYTSPHLIDFRERIKINGQYIHKNSVISFVKKIKPIIDEVQPSFFEITVAMAFYAFARQKVDIAIIETGLGGRLDSTNIIQPLLSVITNIGLEHQDILGETLAEIAFEKAGIIKRNTPVVIGAYLNETKPVFENKSKAENASIHFAQNHYKSIQIEVESSFTSHTILNNYTNKSIDVKCDLKARYQSKNIITVLETIDLVNYYTDFKINTNTVEKGLRNVILNTNFWGRWQQIDQSPNVILDCAHNADGIVEIGYQLALEKYDQLHIIYGCVADKDLKKITALLPKSAQYYITEPPLQRAKSFEDTKTEFLQNGLNISFASQDPKLCLAQALNSAQKNDLILITGSVFLVACFLSD